MPDREAQTRGALMQYDILRVLATETGREWTGGQIVDHPDIRIYHHTAVYKVITAMVGRGLLTRTCPADVAAKERTYRVTDTAVDVIRTQFPAARTGNATDLTALRGEVATGNTPASTLYAALRAAGRPVETRPE
jgi:hypothetical protein